MQTLFSRRKTNIFSCKRSSSSKQRDFFKSKRSGDRHQMKCARSRRRKNRRKKEGAEHGWFVARRPRVAAGRRRLSDETTPSDSRKRRLDSREQRAFSIRRR